MGIDTATISSILLLIATANVVIGLVVLLSGFRDVRRRWFVYALSWSSVWVVTNAIYPYAIGSAQMLTALLSYSSAVFVAMSAVGFCLEMTGLKVVAGLKNLYFIFGSGIALASVLPGVVALQIDADLIIETRPLALTVYGVFILVSFMAGAVLLMAKYKTAKEAERAWLRLVLFGLLAAMVVGVLFNLVLPATGNYRYVQLGPAGTIFFLIASALAMVRYRLLNVRSVAVRTVAYLMAMTALASIYFALAFLLSLVIFKGSTSAGISMNWINVALALVLAFIFQPVKRFFDQVTDKVFYRDRYDTADFLMRLGRILTSTTELHVVLDKAGREIRQTFKASGSLFLVYRDNHPNELTGEGIEKRFSEAELESLRAVALISAGRLLVVRRLGGSNEPNEQVLYALLTKKKVALVLPLISADTVIGYLLLGEHRLSGYTEQDIEVLETIADELVIAIQNARSVQVVRDLNAHLEQRIESATKELRASNSKLIALDAAKDEFVSMASHQLRTPLTSVKGYISMVLEGDAGKISPMQKQLLEEAFMSSERMVHLISDFLNVSRLQTGKFVIDNTKTDLAKLVEQEVDSMVMTAEAHNMKLRFRKPAYFPVLYVDEGKIRQVIMNFIDNAIYYSTERTTITVRLAIEDGDAVLTVKDTGIGVPKSEQVRLFTKFFRAENARRQRPDGTGIGLFLAKKVITAHGGQMVFESEEGKGSTFGFRLPIKKLSTEPVTQSSEPLEPAAKL